MASATRPVPVHSTTDTASVLKAAFSHDASDNDDNDVLEGDEMEPEAISTERTFKDSVHGLITLSQRICKIIDTPQFQRLRHVKQLGTSYYVWPAASHNRFEHCLGVAHLAKMQIKMLKEKQPRLGITDEDVDCVTIAGLCHDLGHGPWSHVWDAMFIPQALPGKKWKHEDASEMMFDDLVKEPTVCVSEREAAIIKALIAGDKTRCSEYNVKPFLFEIVANKRNGLDVDKFDYIARDCHAIGQGENVSLTKLIHSARVIGGEICYDIKDANSIYELCWSRFSLHKRIYNHKTAKAIEHMIIDALLAAEPYIKIAGQIDDPKRYVYLTDDIKLRIQMTTEPELEEARAIFRRIDTRDLYKWVEFKALPWELRTICRQRITPEAIVAAAKSVTALSEEERELADQLDPSHIIVDLSEMHYGMKEHNPLKFVKFYSKRKPNVAKHADSGDISNIMPQAFAEVMLRVYTRQDKFKPLVQQGYRRVLDELVNEQQIDDILDSPATEAADAPGPAGRRKPMSRVTSLRLAPTDEDNLVTPWNSNAFTDVPSGSREASPGMRNVKRGLGTPSGSPPRKRSKAEQ